MASIPEPDPYADKIPLLRSFRLVDFSYDKWMDRRIKKAARQRLIDRYEEEQRQRRMVAARQAAETVADTEARAVRFRARRAGAARAAGPAGST